MAQIKVKEFAKELGVQPELLLEQLQAAGVKKALTEDAALTEKDKTQLLDHLREAHGGKEAKQKITLTRRQTTEIKKADATTGKARTIQVEVRKKRVLIKRDTPEPEKVEEAPKPIIDAAELAVREEEARKQAELAARQADDVAKKRKKEADAEVAAKAADAVAAEPPAAPAAAVDPSIVVEGTIHKPAAPAGDAGEKA
ncbi:MAG: translation initiation factor IF-2 associated domain-containing protein, partial [Burkholderiales bacterium]